MSYRIATTLLLLLLSRTGLAAPERPGRTAFRVTLLGEAAGAAVGAGVGAARYQVHCGDQDCSEFAGFMILAPMLLGFGVGGLTGAGISGKMCDVPPGKVMIGASLGLLGTTVPPLTLVAPLGMPAGAALTVHLSRKPASPPPEGWPEDVPAALRR